MWILSLCFPLLYCSFHCSATFSATFSVPSLSLSLIVVRERPPTSAPPFIHPPFPYPLFNSPETLTPKSLSIPLSLSFYFLLFLVASCKREFPEKNLCNYWGFSFHIVIIMVMAPWHDHHIHISMHVHAIDPITIAMNISLPHLLFTITTLITLLHLLLPLSSVSCFTKPHPTLTSRVRKKERKKRLNFSFWFLFFVLNIESERVKLLMQGLLFEEKTRLGSTPPSCHNKCNQCHPCRPVQVPTLPSHVEPVRSGLTRTVHNPMRVFFDPSPQGNGNKYSNYKPLGWKCRCGDHFFNP